MGSVAEPHAPIRLGAVSYLNTKPLVRGLERRPDLFAVRFDVPSMCAARLHAGEIDLGLIPAIEYPQGDYFIVPNVAIGSDGAVASVAIFSRVPIAQVATLALDPSSRTSVALTRILCREHWCIAPRMTTHEGDLVGALRDNDAALVIGDPALGLDANALGVEKTDLGAAWAAYAGLPFVYAMWCGRGGAIGQDHIAELQAARARGEASIADIAREEARGDARREARAAAYMGDNLKYGLGEREIAGLRRFHALAVKHQLLPGTRKLYFY